MAVPEDTPELLM